MTTPSAQFRRASLLALASSSYSEAHSRRSTSAEVTSTLRKVERGEFVGLSPPYCVSHRDSQRCAHV